MLTQKDTTDDAVLPQFTYTGLSGSFTKGEVIVGATTGTTAIVVATTSSTVTSLSKQQRIPKRVKQSQVKHLVQLQPSTH